MTPEDQNMLPPEQWALGKWIDAKFDDAFGRLDAMQTNFDEYRHEQADYQKKTDGRLTRIEKASLKAAGAREWKSAWGKRFVTATAVLGGLSGFIALFVQHG